MGWAGSRIEQSAFCFITAPWSQQQNGSLAGRATCKMVALRQPQLSTVPNGPQTKIFYKWSYKVGVQIHIWLATDQGFQNQSPPQGRRLGMVREPCLKQNFLGNEVSLWLLEWRSFRDLSQCSLQYTDRFQPIVCPEGRWSQGLANGKDANPWKQATLLSCSLWKSLAVNDPILLEI